MNFWEADIIKLQQRIKELEENPGLRQRLKCYRVFLEQKIKFREEQIEAFRQGERRPIIDMDPLAPCFFRALGFTALDRAAASNQRDGGLGGAMSPLAYKEKARALGLPVDNACDACYTLAGMVAAEHMPQESIISCDEYHCPPRVLQKLFMVHKWPNDIFHFDVPFFETETALEYVVNQLREFIEVAERKFPGVIKYDEDRLIELQARDETARRYNYEIYEMLKHQPSPIAGWDVTDGGEWEYRDPEYLRAKRDEVAERVEKGIAAVPGEKLRVCWIAAPPRFMDPFKVLAKRQMAVIFWYTPIVVEHYRAPVPRPAYYGGRKLTPLEEEAAHMLEHIYGGSGAHYVDNLIRICRDLKIDAIVNWQQLGATCVLGFKRLIEERAEKELGIPTLHLEGKKWDPSYADEATITAKLDEFAQMCLSQRGLA